MILRLPLRALRLRLVADAEEAARLRPGLEAAARTLGLRWEHGLPDAPFGGLDRIHVSVGARHTHTHTHTFTCAHQHTCTHMHTHPCTHICMVPFHARQCIGRRVLKFCFP